MIFAHRKGIESDFFPRAMYPENCSNFFIFQGNVQIFFKLEERKLVNDRRGGNWSNLKRLGNGSDRKEEQENSKLKSDVLFGKEQIQLKVFKSPQPPLWPYNQPSLCHPPNTSFFNIHNHCCFWPACSSPCILFHIIGVQIALASAA